MSAQDAMKIFGDEFLAHIELDVIATGGFDILQCVSIICTGCT
jgi:hypothetical protein